MNKKPFILLVCLLVIFTALGRAQSETKTEWTRIESENREFSIALPSGIQIFSDKKGYSVTTLDAFKKGKFNNVKFKNIRYLTAAEGGAAFYIVSYRTDNLKDGFRVLSGQELGSEQVFNSSINGFAVKIVTATTEKFYRQQMFVGYKDQIYEIVGGARNDKNEALRYFFASIKFNDERAFAAPTALDEKIREQSLALSALTDTPFAVEKEKIDKSQLKPNPPSASLPAGTLPLVIFVKPRAAYSEAARQKMTKGTVVLRVTFAAGGGIEKISVIDDLPDGLTEQAVKAARMIRFVPEEKDGVPQTVVRLVEYSFTIY